MNARTRPVKNEETTARRRSRAAWVLSICLTLAMGVTNASHAAAPAPPPATGGWHPPACPPLGDKGNGPSSLKVTGPCGFEHKGEAECEALADDFVVIVTRKAKNDAELMLFVNVEKYVGAGNYKRPNDIFLSLKDGEKIYRWWSNEFEVTVGPESKSITLQNVKLDPELLLVGCSGPQTNYQCDGRGDEPKHMETLASVTGTIYCKSVKKRH
jgi:hypothetical protein